MPLDDAAVSQLWAKQGSYPCRQGNRLEIFIDGQDAYHEITTCFYSAKQFIYSTISFGDQNFLPVPYTGETFFDIFRNQQAQNVDVRLVIWEPAGDTPDTIPDPSPKTLEGVNQDKRSIHARWDVAKGYSGWYHSPHSHFVPFYLMFPPRLGCHHQKTYIMDDGAGGVVAFVGGINPVQAYWDTQAHDSLDIRRVEKGMGKLQGLENTPPLHDIFYKITGPAVADVLANFVERYNGASLKHADTTADVVPPLTADQIPPIPGGIDLQVLRTIAPDTYPATSAGDRGIREFYLNALSAAGAGDFVYIEDQYFFDHGVISEIHEAAGRGAKVIALLTWKPDEGTALGQAETLLEDMESYSLPTSLVDGQANVALLTLGNSRPDPRSEGKIINSETYIHSKTMSIWSVGAAVMTGGSANIAFTSMWFHSEMNIAFTDAELIKKWTAQLWAEHLQISVDDARALMDKPDDAFTFFSEQAARNKAAMVGGTMPEGRVYFWKDIDFPPRQLDGIDENSLG